MLFAARETRHTNSKEQLFRVAKAPNFSSPALDEREMCHEENNFLARAASSFEAGRTPLATWSKINFSPAEKKDFSAVHTHILGAETAASERWRRRDENSRCARFPGLSSIFGPPKLEDL